jgi:hypothetical protein
MPDKTDLGNEVVDLGQGDYAEVNTDIGYQDRRWWRIRVDKVRRAKGAGRGPQMEPDPDNPAVMREVPGSSAEFTMEDNIGLIEELTARLLVASSVPGLVPWTPEKAEELSHSHGLEACTAIEDAVIAQMNRLNGIAAPKPQTSGGGSGSTSGDASPSPLPAPTPPSSSTPPASSEAGTTPEGPRTSP